MPGRLLFMVIFVTALMLSACGRPETPQQQPPRPIDQKAASTPETRDWEEALRAATPAAYQKFLSEHPSSEHAPEARFNIELARRAAALGIKKVTATLGRIKSMGSSEMVIEVKGPAHMGSRFIPKRGVAQQRIADWHSLVRGPGEFRHGSLVTVYISATDGKTGIPIGIKAASR